MPQYNFSPSGGYDPSKYSILDAVGSLTFVNTSPVTIVNVTGEGFLDFAVIAPSNSNGSNIKVTIDGVVVSYNYIDATYIGGIVNKSVISALASPAKGYVQQNGTTPTLKNLIQYPAIVIGSDGGVYLENPIYFKVSLKVEIEIQNAGTVQYSVKGGIKA